MNANVHYHCLVPDGLFDLRPDGAVQFVPLLSPTDADIENICGQVVRRVHRLLQARDLTDDAFAADDGLNADLTLALAPSSVQARHDAAWEHSQKTKRRCASVDGFSLHANVAVGGEDRKGLARLCRYGLRSSFSLQRLSLRDDGRVCYKLKRPWPYPGGITELVVEPVEFLRRLAMLIPPAKTNLLRYHGVFAPNSSLRQKVLPRLPHPRTCCDPAGRNGRASTSTADELTTQPASTPGAQGPDSRATIEDELPLFLLGPAPDENDLLPVRQRRLDWATLLKRVYAVDVLDCPRCPGRLTVLAAISDPPVVRKILEHLDLPTDSPTMAPARAPPQQEFDC